MELFNLVLDKNNAIKNIRQNKKPPNILKIYDNDVIIYYYFENKLCNKVIISTKSLFVANYIINDYNKNYERIGNTEWVMNSNEYGYAKIYFEFTKNYYNFIWK